MSGVILWVKIWKMLFDLWTHSRTQPFPVMCSGRGHVWTTAWTLINFPENPHWQFPPPDLMILQGNCCKGRVGNESGKINGTPASTPILLERISALVWLSSVLLMPLLMCWRLFSPWLSKSTKEKWNSTKTTSSLLSSAPTRLFPVLLFLRRTSSTHHRGVFKQWWHDNVREKELHE